MKSIGFTVAPVAVWLASLLLATGAGGPRSLSPAPAAPVFAAQPDEPRDESVVEAVPVRFDPVSREIEGWAVQRLLPVCAGGIEAT
jgi:hypothetical protein